MLELYHDWDSLCSFKVRVCLAEKGLDWVERRVALDKFDNLRPGYLALNPNGVVPTLVHEGAVIIESSMINEYLDEVFPDTPLKPADPVRRADMRVWVKYEDDVVHHAVRPATFHLMLKLRVKRMAPGEIEALMANHPMPERAHAYREWATGDVDVDAVQGAIAKFNEILTRMERALAGGPWLCGDDFSLADVAMMPFVDRLEHLRMAALWRDRPVARDSVERVKARPSYTPSTPPEDFRLPRPEDEAIARVMSV
jgi:glutathione S-transferase